MLSDLLTPWFLLAVVLIPLIYAEKWIHSHLFGVGWLLTNDEKSATYLYYFFLFPGILVHEAIQWLVAGALNVEIKRISVWPEPQDDGTLRLDFVQIDDKKTNWLPLAIIGAAPLIVGVGIVLYVSNQVLNLEDFLSALGTGDVTTIGPAIQALGSTPDFYLWLYLMFAVSNAMLPTPADRRGWPLLIGLFLAAIVFLILIGVGDVLLETFTGPVTHALNILTTAFSTVLAVEFFAIVVVGFVEEILERTTKRKFQYGRPASEPTRRKPGSNLPLPPDAPLPSIYNLNLPVPDPKQHSALMAKRRVGFDAPPTPLTPSPAGAMPAPATRDRPSRLEAGPATAGTAGPERPFSAPTDRPELRPGSLTASRSSPEAPSRRSPGDEGPGAAGDRLTDFRRRSRPGDQPERPVSRPARRPPGDEAEDDEQARPSAFRRRSRPGDQPERPVSQPARRPLGDEAEDDEQAPPSAFRRRSRPGDQPGRPGLRPSRENEDEEPLSRGLPVPSRPARPGFAGSRTVAHEDIEDDEDTTVEDDDYLASFRRPRTPRDRRGSHSRPISPIGINGDAENDDEGDDLEYVDFDDI